MEYFKLMLWAVAIGVIIGIMQDAFKGGDPLWIIGVVLLSLFIAWRFIIALRRVW